jgi:hypothetical protein
MGQQSTVVMCTYHWIKSTPGISCQINVKLNQELQLGRIHWKRIPEKKYREEHSALRGMDRIEGKRSLTDG